MSAEPLRLLVMGAHPDDAEFRAGGLSAMYRDLGHTVKFISATNGDAGHHIMRGEVLAARRRQEADAVAKLLGIAYDIWSHHDGQLVADLSLREQVIREIRTFKPDLVLTHRPDDYHPDHRALAQAVRDASFMVTVPAIVPDAPALRKDPVVAYLSDRFTKPTELQADVIIDVTEKVEVIVSMLQCHESQLIEWLPYNGRVEDQVPKDAAGRRQWVRDFYTSRTRSLAERYRRELVETYGPARGSRIEFAEVFEVSEYASPLDAAERKRLFPFLP